jgi:hypothetical protein
MQVKVKTNGKLTADEREELKKSEVSGVLIAHQAIHEEVVSEFWSRARAALSLDPLKGVILLNQNACNCLPLRRKKTALLPRIHKPERFQARRALFVIRLWNPQRRFI